MAATPSQQLQGLWANDFQGVYPYAFSYFSGSQIFIFAGNVLIDEAVFLGYNLTNNKVPLYGYASPYWDAVAQGTVIVQGSLGVNYIDNKYMSLIALDCYMQKSGALPVSTPQINANASPGDYLQALAQGMGSNLITGQGAGSSAFKTAAANLKTQFWGGGKSTLKAMPRLDQYPSLDIGFTYGTPNRSSGNNSTAKMLEQVTFNGESQTIEINGQPVLEIYQFIARRVINPVNNSASTNTNPNSGVVTPTQGTVNA